MLLTLMKYTSRFLVVASFQGDHNLARVHDRNYERAPLASHEARGINIYVQTNGSIDAQAFGVR